MTAPDKHIAQKKMEIEKITRQQERLIKKMKIIAGLPYKRPATVTRRAGKFMAIISRIRSLEIQKQLIIVQPIPKYETGGGVMGNMAVIAVTGPEYIAVGNYKIYPTALVNLIPF